MLSETMPRYYQAQPVAWQLGLPILLPPWTATNPFDWLWFPLTDLDAYPFLKCEITDLEQWSGSFGLPALDRLGSRMCQVQALAARAAEAHEACLLNWPCLLPLSTLLTG